MPATTIANCWRRSKCLFPEISLCDVVPQETDETATHLASLMSVIEVRSSSTRSQIERLNAVGLTSFIQEPPEERIKIIKRWLNLECDPKIINAEMQDLYENISNEENLSEASNLSESYCAPIANSTFMFNDSLSLSEPSFGDCPNSTVDPALIAKDILENSRRSMEAAKESGDSVLISITQESYLNLRSQLESKLNLVL